MYTLRVLLVNTSRPFMESMKRLVTMDKRIQVVGLACSSVEALDCIDRLQPDLVMVDLLIPGLNGLEVARYIKAETNGPCIVIMALEDTPVYREAARDALADGFLSKQEIGAQWQPLISNLFPQLADALEICSTFSE